MYPEGCGVNMAQKKSHSSTNSRLFWLPKQDRLAEAKMKCKLPLMVGAIFVASALSASGSVQAQEFREGEAELANLHRLCDEGDRRACVRFGAMLHEHRERHEEWRRSHPEFWWWERERERD